MSTLSADELSTPQYPLAVSSPEPNQHHKKVAFDVDDNLFEGDSKSLEDHLSESSEGSDVIELRKKKIAESDDSPTPHNAGKTDFSAGAHDVSITKKLMVEDSFRSDFTDQPVSYSSPYLPNAQNLKSPSTFFKKATVK